MLKASATVIHLGNINMVNDGSSPIRRPRIAVEYKENVDARAIDVKISAACLFTSFLALNIENANDMITDPRKPIRTSPAPGLEATFV